jgi:hypothetical protein
MVVNRACRQLIFGGFVALLCALPGCTEGRDAGGVRRQSALEMVQTIAGGDTAGPRDGFGTNALFDYPVDIATMRDDDGRELILVADTFNGGYPCVCVRVCEHA